MDHGKCRGDMSRNELETGVHGVRLTSSRYGTSVVVARHHCEVIREAVKKRGAHHWIGDVRDETFGSFEIFDASCDRFGAIGQKSSGRGNPKSVFRTVMPYGLELVHQRRYIVALEI
jgi:hypothetical protein